MSEEQKLPRGVAMMIRSILGVDPETLFNTLQSQAQQMMQFCKYFDDRMIELNKQTHALTLEIGHLRQEITTLKSEIQYGRSNGSTIEGDRGSDFATGNSNRPNLAIPFSGYPQSPSDD